MNMAVRERNFFATWAGAWKAAMRRRAAAWARRRQGEDRLPIAIAARRVYILPTRSGLAFAALLFVMLIAGLNYGNSVALMITFLLTGFGLIAMHLTHRNLLGVVVRGVAPVDAFAGEHGLLLLTLQSAGKAGHFAIDCEVEGSRRVPIELRETGSARADIAVPLAKRGRVVVRRIKLSTAFPFGLFRAWTYVHLDLALLAWPVPRGRREPPPEVSTGGAATAVHRAGDEEWAGLRDFRSGDSPRQVAWAAYARGRGLLVKTYQSPAAHHRLFDLASVGGGLEERLGQLSAWVMAAHARGERFGLRLGGAEIPTDGGSGHRKRCLDALALYGETGDCNADARP
ncbi:MAG TPA: DUF58 domain-containing protein [Steroidobacteraceae bacterium]|nr:DUF58 domain-containing protein [Steroidobacteraceae bacterium]